MLLSSIEESGNCCSLYCKGSLFSLLTRYHVAFLWKAVWGSQHLPGCWVMLVLLPALSLHFASDSWSLFGFPPCNWFSRFVIAEPNADRLF